VNGSIANSAVTVNSGATLGGTGIVGATTINSGGIFAPGTAGTPAAMTVQGNLAFQSGALYLVRVTPSNASSDKVTSGGTASLAGTVQAAFASGTYATRAYTILSAAGGLDAPDVDPLLRLRLVQDVLETRDAAAPRSDSADSSRRKLTHSPSLSDRHSRSARTPPRRARSRWHRAC